MQKTSEMTRDIKSMTKEELTALITRLACEKGFPAGTMGERDKSLDHVLLLCLDIDHLSGKQAVELLQSGKPSYIYPFFS